MDHIYTFVYKGILADESLDKVGRRKKNNFGKEQVEEIENNLSFDLLDSDLMIEAERMSIIYIAIHTFENMVRVFVKNGLTEKFKEGWWDHVPERIRKKVASRIEDDSKFKWHGARGGSEIEFCDFGDLSSIIVTNWDVFEAVLSDLEWSKSVLSVLERSRNIVMHGGVLARQDIERIGGNIGDWIRQAG
ncbi:Swt1 family HEPN domain-containing protein [Sneathiella sp.]|uniref:Swt1 family HEPN domain-containing protein n=1 Tax=Sneathiella sp. TaxID=1964365 RepID=UPI00261583CD|nr:Swt1 family HEPN domain-containing protein [Sneathiella sp.]MDF2366487.1 Swt1 family HEPN domain-containing protein [Sneathiella sp.]